MAGKIVVKPEPLATTEEVAAVLRDVPKHTLEQWRSQGRGPKYIKVGRHVRYRWADVNAWLDEQTAAVA
jgi:excisionase family DNA binding protein